MVDRAGEAVLEHLPSLPADETQVLGERNDKSTKGKRNLWTRPPPGFTKLNVDASFDPDLLQDTVGVVLHDNAGKFIATSNSVIGVCLDVFMAEALAFRFGLNLATSVGYNTLILNSDNTDVIA
ncbi:Mitochondrial outer membrane porin [Hordeum vulgare]|nr:Mitochondrial outer membrane porin [Hordeum vulgare]